MGLQASEKVKLTSSEDVFVFVFGVRSVHFHLHFFFVSKELSQFFFFFSGGIANIHSFRRVKSYRKKDEVSAVPQIQK